MRLHWVNALGLSLHPNSNPVLWSNGGKNYFIYCLTIINYE